MRLPAWLRGLLGRSPETAAVAVPEASAGLSPFPAEAGPSRLIVLRHAEKSGDRNDPHLSLAGRRRAEQLVQYVPATFGTPHFLIAARTSMRSRRPAETLEPLAAKLALEIRARFEDDDSAGLVKKLRDKQRHRAKIGMICWRHSTLPELLQALGAPAETCSKLWDEDDYTTIVDLSYPGDGQVIARRLRMPF